MANNKENRKAPYHWPFVRRVRQWFFTQMASNGESVPMLWRQLQLIYPDSKVHRANMGPIWVLLAPDGPHVGSMNLAIRVLVHDVRTSISSCPSGMRLSVTSPGQCESINECAESNPCRHGRCMDRMFGYKCRCEREWRGRHCNKLRRRNRKQRQRDRGDRGK